MEIFYLLCSILSTFFTSLTLSLLLPFRLLLTRLRPPLSTTNFEPVSLYEGTVWHERRRPVRHSLRYSVRYALFDLDHSPNTPPGHLSADEARRITKTDGPVFLLTIPPSVGYEQNPLSLYYCYDLEGTDKLLKKCIAEVTNTPWGERVSFVFNPNSDLVAKPLHVSPFMDMLGSWSLRANAPGQNLLVTISVQHPELGDYFLATLKAKRVSLESVHDHALYFWLMPHKVALWIYWHLDSVLFGNAPEVEWPLVLQFPLGSTSYQVIQPAGGCIEMHLLDASQFNQCMHSRSHCIFFQALKLWWKNVSFIQHPRYTNPSYREEALNRDRKLQCCPGLRQNQDEHMQVGGSDSATEAERYHGERFFVWKDAKWPWC